jgi:quercetin dioxygenase-like cupin family protein
MHAHGRFDAKALAPDPVLAGRSNGSSRAILVDAAVGSPHQRVAIVELAPGGFVDNHFHSYEEAVYVFAGRVELTLGGAKHELGTDGFAFAETGSEHAWRNVGDDTARWFEVSAPQPKPVGADFPDTFFGASSVESGAAGSHVGHFDPTDFPPLALAGFTAANVSGASLQMLVNRDLDAAHLILFTVQYAPGGLIKEHDHTFEEAYFFVEGEIEAYAEGKTYRVEAGDWFWTSVGCPHAFTNRADGPVRWLETQVPQPPSRDAARFKADWPTA